MYRTILERSIMTNNDEFIGYTDEQITDDKFNGCDVVLSREVFQEEIEAGLKIHKDFISVWKIKDNPPQLTRFLDAVCKFRDYISRWKKVSNDPIHVRNLVRIWATGYYDCMSGGMPLWEGVLIAHISKYFNLDMDMELYPKSQEYNTPDNPDIDKNSNNDSWYTLRDFCKSFSKHENIVEDMMKEIGHKLPPIPELKLPVE